MPSTAMLLVFCSICRIPSASLMRFVFQSVISPPPMREGSKKRAEYRSVTLRFCWFKYKNEEADRMKRAAVFLFLSLAVPAVLLAEGVTRRMIVATRQPALVSLQRMRGEDFDPGNRVRYDIVPFKYINAFAADLDETEIAKLKKSPEVEYIEEDPERHIL